MFGHLDIETSNFAYNNTSVITTKLSGISTVAITSDYCTPRRTPMDMKFMVIVAINFEGLSFYRVLEPNETVDSECYMNFLNNAFASFSTCKLRQA